MNYKKSVKQLFEALTGTRIYRVLPRGLDPFADIRTHLPFLEVSTIFDVGANVGQSAKKFSRYFPNSEIYCFEPVAETYRELQRELGARFNVHTFQFALGARPGQKADGPGGRSRNVPPSTRRRRRGP